MDTPLEKADGADDPRRCQGITSRGQCWNKAEIDSDMCRWHGGWRAVKARTTLQVLRSAYLLKYATPDGDLMSLRTEVMAMKALIGAKLSLVHDEQTMMIHSGSLADLIAKSDKLVNSCLTLDAKLANLLSLDQARSFASELMSIVLACVASEDEVAAIYERMSECVARLSTAPATFTPSADGDPPRLQSNCSHDQ